MLKVLCSVELHLGAAPATTIKWWNKMANTWGYASARALTTKLYQHIFTATVALKFDWVHVTIFISVIPHLKY